MTYDVQLNYQCSKTICGIEARNYKQALKLAKEAADDVDFDFVDYDSATIFDGEGDFKAALDKNDKVIDK